MDERFKSHAWKACEGSNPPRVRIPPDPPENKNPATATLQGFLLSVYFVVCTIFMADAINAETSVMLLGTIRVVVASAATLE